MPYIYGRCQNNMSNLKSYYKLKGLYLIHLITGAAIIKEHLSDFLNHHHSFQYLESVIMVMVYYTPIIHIWFGHPKREHKNNVIDRFVITKFYLIIHNSYFKWI